MVSILIPVFNREDYISQTIDSALNQTYTDIELIIVDNFSTDNTWAIINSYAQEDKRIKIFQNDRNLGPVRNWKRCIDEATGEYGKILWSDDLIAPEFIEKTLPLLEERGDIGFVFTGTQVFNEKTGKRAKAYFIGKSGSYNSVKYIEAALFSISKYPYSPGCGLFRLKDLRSNLLIDIPNKIGSDFSMHAVGNDLLIYLITASKYPFFAFIDETLAFFREHEQSITVSTETEKVSLLYTLAKSYFVEYFLKCNKRLSKKFNAFLLLQCIKYKNNSLGLNKINDFYSKETSFKISYAYLLKKILARPVRYLKAFLES